MDAMQAEPQEQHRWLQQMIGRWSFASEATMGPGQPSMRSEGTEVVRALGGLWVVAEGAGTTPDGKPANWMMTLGFDPKKGCFTGTWVGSMMTLLWVYDGFLDAERRVLTLEADGPSFTDGTKLAKYRDIIRIESPDHRVMTSHALGDDGSWTGFMTAHYRRIG
ncbi:MAG TPA: DUF1579 domain-containing protein [Roseomonas sp.]|jgi:hypothetical protein